MTATHAISEAVSKLNGRVTEAAPKKRGRPALTPDAVLNGHTAPLTSAGTRRGQQDALYRSRALGALRADPEGIAASFDAFTWLQARGSVLTELGRLAVALGDDAACRVAAVLYRRRPSAKVAIAKIRHARLRRDGLGSRKALVARLAAAVERYRAENAGVTPALVLEALSDMRKRIKGARP